jgi:multiple sugar transport system ATP-binding protein
MADRIGVMAKGRLQQIGTPEQLLDDPRNMFVARFIGPPPMNLIPGWLAVDGGEYQVEADGVRLPLSCEWKPVLDRYAKRDVVLGIRPDRMTMSSAGADAISAIVADVEPLIGETSVVFHLAGGDSLIGMFAEDMDALSPGLPVQIAVQSDGIELFDPETELSLRAG